MKKLYGQDAINKINATSKNSKNYKLAMENINYACAQLDKEKQKSLIETGSFEREGKIFEINISVYGKTERMSVCVHPMFFISEKIDRTSKIKRISMADCKI